VIRLVLGAALAFAALYVVVLFVLWRFQERVVFQPPVGIAASPVPARQVRYRSADGIDLFAYVVGDCVPGSTVMLAFHGNADLARWFVPWGLSVARETGACVVIPEYRGYDGVSGAPTYAGSQQDARAALEYVKSTLQASPQDIVYFGHSLGTAIAAELAESQTPRVLILQSPFTSARDMGRRMFLPGLVAFWDIVSRVHFDTIKRLRTLNVPVWVSHGDADYVIPVRMGREVFDAVRKKGELLIVEGAGHNDVATVGGRDYWSWLSRAVASGRESLNPVARSGTQSEP
jgi:pimeloyl-ACP methyl ester carboxylesterase